MTRHPSGFGRFLCALDFHLGPRVEIALIGADGDGLAPLVAEVFGRFLPNRVVAGMLRADARAAAGMPLLESRGTSTAAPPPTSVETTRASFRSPTAPRSRASWRHYEAIPH